MVSIRPSLDVQLFHRQHHTWWENRLPLHMCECQEMQPNNNMYTGTRWQWAQPQQELIGPHRKWLVHTGSEWVNTVTTHDTGSEPRSHKDGVRLHAPLPCLTSMYIHVTMTTDYWQVGVRWHAPSNLPHQAHGFSQCVQSFIHVHNFWPSLVHSSQYHCNYHHKLYNL